MKDLIFYNFHDFGATYEESTPLAEPGPHGRDHDPDVWTEPYPPAFRASFRGSSYTYTQDIQLPQPGPNEKHLVTYGLSYAF